MKQFLRGLSYCMIAVFFCVALSGCAKKQAADPDANKIVVWSFENEDIWKPIQEEFEKTNKGYTLVYQKQPFDSQYETRVLNSILSGKGPDVWSMPNDWIYRHKDEVYPLSVKASSALNIDSTYVPVVKQSTVINNQVYAMTPSAEPLMIFYNSKLFSDSLNAYQDTYSADEDKDKRDRADQVLSAFPKTWTDFTDAIKILTKKDASGNITQAGVAMGTDRVSNAQDILYLLMLQNNTKIISEDLKLAMFNQPLETPKTTPDIPGQRAMDFYTSFANPSNANYTWNDSLGNDLDAFAKGKVAMIFAYNDEESTLAQKYPNFTYNKASVPQLTEESSKIVDFARFNAFTVSKTTKNPAPSWNLVRGLAGDWGDNFVSGAGLFTSQKSPSYDITLENRNSDNPEKLELATAKTFSKGRYPTEFDNYIKNAIYAVNKNLQDSKAALDLAASNITDLLKKETW